MNKSAHPRVIVGVDNSLSGLAALRRAVAEARRRRVPLQAVRSCTGSLPAAEHVTVKLAFLQALGTMPVDIGIQQELTFLTATKALRTNAADPRDLIVVGNSCKGGWHAFWAGSVSRSLIRRAPCPILAVPAPEMTEAVRRRRRREHLLHRDLWEQFEHQVPESHETSSSRTDLPD